MLLPKYRFQKAGRRQRGAVTIVIAVILLVIITLSTMFAASVSLFEVRTSANELRANRAFDATQQGLNLGLEYLRANRATISSTMDGGWFEEDLEWWERCPADGVVADDFPCDAEPDATRRQRLYRFRGPPGAAVAARYRLPIEQPSAISPIDLDGDGVREASEASGRYRVGALICLIDPAVTPTQCSLLNPARPQQAFAIQVVARGAVMSADATAAALPEATNAAGQPLAEARSSLSQVFSSYRMISGGPEAPLIAANSVTLRGTFDIVPNPNAGGFGIPMSIWSSSTIDPNGTPKSCYLQEFLSSSPADVTYVDGVPTCDRCQCPRDGALSYKDGGDYVKGPDIIDAVGGTLVTGAQNFPTDLFNYMFGVPRSRWTEVRARTDILTGACTGDPLAPGCCADLGATSTGLYWSTEDTCSISADQVGSPSQPLMLVIEKGFDLGSESFFGVLYKFDDPTNTTNYTLRVNGGGAIYGALVADNDSVVDKATGNFAIVYNADVMNRLVNSPGFLRVGPLPGSWNDLASY